jgi:heme-degrading monooxygenase HmoA
LWVFAPQAIVAAWRFHMIGVLVTFQFGSDFDGAKIRKIAETARPRFEGMPGLRSKTFTVNASARQAVNVYVWDSEDAAKAFFNEELVQRVTALYGVRPAIAFVEIAALVDNAKK